MGQTLSQYAARCNLATLISVRGPTKKAKSRSRTLVLSLHDSQGQYQESIIKPPTQEDASNDLEE